MANDTNEELRYYPNTFTNINQFFDLKHMRLKAKERISMFKAGEISLTKEEFEDLQMINDGLKMPLVNAFGITGQKNVDAEQ
jgi:hypothetical protein